MPASVELLAQAAASGENHGSITSALLRLVDRYGALEVQTVVLTALSRIVPHPNVVRLASETQREARQAQIPVVVQLSEKVRLHDTVIHAGEMLGKLAALDSDAALRRRLRHYVTPDLWVIDEIGYLSYSNRQADLLFERNHLDPIPFQEYRNGIHERLAGLWKGSMYSSFFRPFAHFHLDDSRFAHFFCQLNDLFPTFRRESDHYLENSPLCEKS